MRLIFLIVSIMLALAGAVQCQEAAPDFFDQGEALKKLGKYDQALLALDEAIAIDPGNPEAWKSKCSALISWASMMKQCGPVMKQ